MQLLNQLKNFKTAKQRGHFGKDILPVLPAIILDEFVKIVFTETSL